MTYREAKREFSMLYPSYKSDAHKDYCRVQLAWACFTDGLCKDGRITQKQYDKWLPPFRESRK